MIPEAMYIQLDMPLRSVHVIASTQSMYFDVDPDVPESDVSLQQALLAEQLENEKSMFSQALNNLNDITKKLNTFSDKLFAEHSSDIIKLSLKVAEKILAKKIESSDYDIGAIIERALNDVTHRVDIKVYLNPNDLENLNNCLEGSRLNNFENIRFTPDANIGPAQCRVETPNETIACMIEDQLSKIQQALLKVC